MVLTLMPSKIVMSSVGFAASLDLTDEVHPAVFVQMCLLVPLKIFVVQECSGAACMRADKSAVLVISMMVIEVGLYFEFLATAAT